MASENQNVEELRAEVLQMKEQMSQMSKAMDDMTQVGKMLEKMMRGKFGDATKEDQSAANAGGSTQSTNPPPEQETLDPPVNEEERTIPKVTGETNSTGKSPHKIVINTTDHLEKNQTDPETRELLKSLAARVKAVEGNKPYGIRSTLDMCLVPGLSIPADFKVPDFEKYDGSTCPQQHLTMYARRMTNFAENDKMMIHFFQDSLSGAASGWYMRLEKDQIHTFEDLAEAFINQYRFNMDIAPDRFYLQSMARKPAETFRDYAMRWRSVASQVTPPLTKREMNSMFLDTLPPSYYEKMVGVMTADFADMIMVGEKIDSGLRLGKISGGEKGETSRRPGFLKKKEGEANALFHQNVYTPQVARTSNQTQAQTTTHIPNNPHQTNTNQTQATQYQNKPTRPRRVFDPIPMSYPEIYAYLLAQGAITPVPGKIGNPRPLWFDEKKHCEYHMGIEGHDLTSCITLKHKVQDLIDQGLLSFKVAAPNVNNNPLPEHSANMLEKESDEVITQLEKTSTPIGVIFQGMIAAGLIEAVGKVEEEVKERNCIFHGTEDHSIEACMEVRILIQKLMDFGYLQICKKVKGNEINVIEGTSHQPKMVPVYQPLRKEPCFEKYEPSLVAKPTPFPYSNSQAVPWKYGKPTNPNITPDISNVTGVGGMTRSGRIYQPQDGPESSKVKLTKAFEKVSTNEKEMNDKKPKVTEEEASEFLKYIKHSEFQVVDQLHQTPAKISVLSLLMSSESHRNALLRILNEAHVPQSISLDKFEGIVGHIVADNYVTFTDDEIPAEGTGHVKPLHISIMCKGHSMGRVLIDNGSSLNVMPLVTLKKLPVDLSHMRPSSMIVKAFDGGRRAVLGEIDIPIKIGPCTFEILFQVMDFVPSYSCLLGRPWIHTSGAVPSTLHQKLKFVTDGKLVTVSGEEDIIVYHSSNAPYVDVAEEALEIAFQALEIANVSYVGEGSQLLEPKLSKATMMIARTMISEGYQYGKGLGKHGQGVVDLITPKGNKERFGLGYKPSRIDWARISEDKKKKRLARLGSEEYIAGPIPIGPLYESFRSAGFEFKGQVNAIEEDHQQDIGAEMCWIRPRPPGFELNNWDVVEFPEIVKTTVQM